MPGVHKIVKIFTKAKLNDKIVNVKDDPLKILKKSEGDNLLYKYGKNTHFCAYKTKYNDKDAIMMLFAIKLSNTVESSMSSETVMEIINLLEKSLIPIDDYKYITNVDGVDKNVAILRIIKLISEFDVI